MMKEEKFDSVWKDASPRFTIEYISPHEEFPYYVIQNNMMGHRCGYVRVPSDHPYCELRYDVPVDVHGGVTWNDEHEVIGSRVIGFDCGHSGDAPDPEIMNPEMREHRLGVMRFLSNGSGVVRSSSYVKQECMKLRDQLLAAYREYQARKAKV